MPYFRYHISRGIGAYRKFAQRKGIVMHQHIVLDITSAFFRIREVATVVVCHHTVLEINFKIPVFQSV